MSTFFSTSELKKQTRMHVDKTELKPDCLKCGAHRGCKSPKLKPYGKGRKKILIINSSTSYRDDNNGIPMSGEEDDFIIDLLRDNGIDVKKDCWRMNSVACFSSKAKFPERKHVKYCSPNVTSVIHKLKPKAILVIGDNSLVSLYHKDFKNKSLESDTFRGIIIPDRELNSNVFAIHDHRSLYYDNKNKSLKTTLERDIKKFKSKYASKFTSRAQEFEKSVRLLLDFKSLKETLQNVLNTAKFVYIDYEATGLKPFRNGHKIVSMALTTDGKKCYAFPLRWKSFWTQSELKNIEYLVRKILKNKRIKKAAHNLPFEDNWSNVHLGPVRGWEWDTMLGAHIIDNRSYFTGEKFQTYINFGIRPYDKDISPFLKAHRGEFNRIEELDLKDLLTYNAYDVFFGYNLREIQKKFFIKHKSLLEPFKMYLSGEYEMSSIQLQGMKANEEFYTRSQKKTRKKVKKLKKELTSGKEARKFKKHTGRNIKITSGRDLATLFFKIMDFKGEKTDKGNYKTDKETLENLRIPYATKLLTMKKLETADSRYLKNFFKEVYAGQIYPNFSLTIPRSYRSSSSRPNFQNLPKHDEEVMRIIRSGIIPELDAYLVEADFSGAEVITSLCYHGDQNFKHDITVGDMHRDFACDLFFLRAKDFKNPKFNKKELKLMKDLRYQAKNKWTFAQFYGDWYGSSIPKLWDLAPHMSVPIKHGKIITLKEHLAENNIYSLEDYMTVGEELQNNMWFERFSDYTKWKNDIYNEYLKNGYLTNFFGFVFQGLMTKNQCNNFPIQSASFQLLLHTLIKVQKFIRKNKLRTRLIGQIHDSIIANVPKDEFDIYTKTVHKIVSNLKKEFDWIVLPMEVEIERSKLGRDGGNFAEMEEYKLRV